MKNIILAMTIFDKYGATEQNLLGGTNCLVVKGVVVSDDDKRLLDSLGFIHYQNGWFVKNLDGATA